MSFHVYTNIMWVVIIFIVIVFIILYHQSKNKNKARLAQQNHKQKALTQIQLDQLIVSSTLYNLYFSKEFADLFLNDSPDRIIIGEKLGTLTDENEDFLLKLIRSILVIKYNIIVNKDSPPKYTHNSYHFNWINMREEINSFSHLEILWNDIVDVINTNDTPEAVPNNLVIYVRYKEPIYLFAVVYDPVNEKFAIREIYNNGRSSLVQFLENNNKLTIVDVINNHTSKRPYTSNS